MINTKQYRGVSSSLHPSPRWSLRGNQLIPNSYPTRSPIRPELGIEVQTTRESVLTPKGGNPEESLGVAGGDGGMGGGGTPGESEIIAAFVESVVLPQIERDRKVRTIWNTSLQVIGGLAGVWEASANPEILYQKLAGEGRSWGYSCKLIGMMNKLGRFAAAKMGRGFQKIHDPPRRKMAGGNPSIPMTEELLAKASRGMKVEHYNWLFISFWLGLRPKEVDRLVSDFNSSARLTFENSISEVGGRGGGVLWVKQHKLYQVEEEKKWKAIPLLLDEQKQAITLFQSRGEVRRPSRGTLRRHLGVGVHSYCGRKGFAGALLKRGYPIEAISLMLGHESVERTRKTYASHEDILNQRLGALWGKLAGAQENYRSVV